MNNLIIWCIYVQISLIIVNGYQIPEPELISFLPGYGFSISIPDEGLSSVTFHIKINGKFEGWEAGDFSRKLNMKRNGKWLYENNFDLGLQPGDTVYYWIHVIKDEQEYIRKNGWIILTKRNFVSKGLPTNLLSSSIMMQRYITKNNE